MKKAIIRVEIEYDENETNPDKIAEKFITLAQDRKIYQLKKHKDGKKTIFMTDTFPLRSHWSILNIYYPYGVKPKQDDDE